MVNQSEFNLRKYSIGVDDRFGHQGTAHLAAVQKAVVIGGLGGGSSLTKYRIIEEITWIFRILG